MAAQWYYKLSNEEFGPVSSSELKRLAEAKTIVPDTFVKREADSDWVRAHRVSGLFPPPAGTAPPTRTSEPAAPGIQKPKPEPGKNQSIPQSSTPPPRKRRAPAPSISGPHSGRLPIEERNLADRQSGPSPTTWTDGQDINVTRFRLYYKDHSRLLGLLPGDYASSGWDFPAMCACCGGEADDYHKEKRSTLFGAEGAQQEIYVPYCMTCMEHVGARARQALIAQWIAISLAVITFIGTAVLGASIGVLKPGRDMGASEAPIICIMLAIAGAAYVAAYFGFKRLLAMVGGLLPRTETCSAGLKVKLTKSKDADLETVLDCFNPAFIEVFREENQECIGKEEQATGIALRGPGGDFQIKKIRVIRLVSKLGVRIAGDTK